MACEAWDFDMDPRFASDTLDAMPPGTLSFGATRTAVIDGVESTVKVDVVEVWREGADPEGDWRLELDGCHLEVCSWHAQVGTGTGAAGAERLDVVAVEDEAHPRIHRHPYGQHNEVREPTGMAVPDGWLNHLSRILNGALDDGDVPWDELDA
jgi:hypothetical protein